MGRDKPNVTTLHNATSTSSSLRTTISEHIALNLGLDSEVQIKWDMEKKDGMWYAKFKEKNIETKKRVRK